MRRILFVIGISDRGNVLVSEDEGDIMTLIMRAGILYPVRSGV